MNENKMLKILRFSAVFFGLAGFFLGSVFFGNSATAFAALGMTFGTLIGIGAACYCLVINRRNCVSMASLVGNMILFVVIAREMQIIG